MLQTPDGSVAGEVAGDPRGQDARAKGRQSFQEPNRQGQHLAAHHQGWGTRMIGEPLYRQTLMITRKLGDDAMRSKINSRKRVEGECCNEIGENGEGGRTVSVSLWRASLKDAFLHHFLGGHTRFSESRWGIAEKMGIREGS